MDAERLAAIKARAQDIYCTNNPGNLPRGVTALLLEDVPALASEIERLQAQNDRLREAVEYSIGATRQAITSNRAEKACRLIESEACAALGEHWTPILTAVSDRPQPDQRAPHQPPPRP